MPPASMCPHNRVMCSALKASPNRDSKCFVKLACEIFSSPLASSQKKLSMLKFFDNISCRNFPATCPEAASISWRHLPRTPSTIPLAFFFANSTLPIIFNKSRFASTIAVLGDSFGNSACWAVIVFFASSAAVATTWAKRSAFSETAAGVANDSTSSFDKDTMVFVASSRLATAASKAAILATAGARRASASRRSLRKTCAIFSWASFLL
mmetsp:Transcript_54377/g.157207  ORF Transcript_54377/g.157207 Transcript_54377/m.157207 type:complete len:210 (+) Transcript_54377:1398-2027(+)